MSSRLIRHGQFDVVFGFDPQIMSEKVVAMIESGKYERKEAKAILKHVKSGSSILELGGGLGFISTFVKKRKRPSSYHVVEADPRLIGVIAETHRLNDIKGVTVQNCVATSDAKLIAGKSISLNLGADFWGSSIKRPAGVAGSVQVPVVSLQELIDRSKPNVLIIDIEGAEVDLFETLDLSHVSTIIVEIHPKVTGEEPVAAMRGVLAKAGLRPKRGKKRPAVMVFKRSWLHSIARWFAVIGSQRKVRRSND
jgi:FkbM family methyltransferase